MQMKILLLAHEEDDHAAPVRWALEQAGYEAACWSGVSAVEQERASLVYGAQPEICLGGHALHRGDAAWLRQPRWLSPDAETADEPQVLPFLDAVAAMMEALPLRCVNKFSASNLVNNKAVQLRLAGDAGLRTPQTLMSNAPEAVRAFFDKHPDDLVCKPFASHIWQQQESGELAVTGTFALGREQLPAEDEVFTYAPAIYQQRVAKQFDVRAVLMGKSVYSFAVRTPSKALDWRLDGAMRKIEVEMIATPAAVKNGLLRLAEKTGICFGSADFAVDMRGDWWFLEINEQGQFLWLEQFVPQAALLQKFCAFLIATDDGGESLEDRQRQFPSLADYARTHPQREVRDFRASGTDVGYKSVEP
jgi:hypothetical protein